MTKSNKFFTGPQCGEKPKLWELICIPIAFMLVQSIVLMMIGGANNSLQTLGFGFAITLLIGSGVPALLLFYFVKKIKKWESGTLGFYKESSVKQYLMGALIAFVALTTIVIILMLTGQIAMRFTVNSISLGGVGIAIIIILGWIVQGASEEMLLRGYLFQGVSSIAGWYKGLIISAVIFAFLHVGNSGITVISMLNILLCGLSLGLLCMVQQSIWGACAFHAVWNLLQGNVYGSPVSGVHNGLSLFQISYTESTIFNGAGFGIEGSFLTTIFFIIMITVLVGKVRTEIME
ncbi:MAG: lysostaphin resistance A-like protein [Cellulosilyticaceae bacterium]